jgi:exo-beta-1,3-glucanase (GH17 family)/cellulose synthase/poly-beta-1,6-N-acetylglucosamine synthase-like glycosyltransferase
MTRANFIVIVSAAMLTVALFALFNQPTHEAPWPERIQGFAFSPYREGETPLAHRLPTAAEIDQDLALLQGKTYAIRTYSTEGVLADIPAMAARYGINVAMGAWIDGRLDNNETELARLIATAPRHRNVVRAIVGNEALLRGDVTSQQLIGYLDRARRALSIPVSTAEPWHVWLKHPELADHVDYIAVHMLPYWEGIDVKRAVDYIDARMHALHAAFPGKPIVITEVGWPSEGRTRAAAVASKANEAIFLRRFLARAAERHYVYYVMEAFDQTWKQDTEGAVGAYWGVYDVQRRPKFAFIAPIVHIPSWPVLAMLSVILAVIVLTALLVDSRTLRPLGRGFLAIVAYAVATSAVWIVYDYTQRYLSVASVLVGLLLVFGMIGVILVLLAEAHEWAEAHWVRDHRRIAQPPAMDEAALPMVSIHVPAYNEPPQMVIDTLDALARLDYPRFEVIVVDNNTADPEVWRPVAAHCRHLGPRFRFFHEDELSGFKAGALNYALARTASEASIVAVIDSDYTVEPDWLRQSVPLFAAPQLAIVQAPQDYRDEAANAFKAMCYAEYRGFFHIGMVTRNERNAIIQHGTMTLVRRAALEAVGGWSEWCITEDAELGLKLFAEGLEAMYVPHSYGKGLMPDSFSDFKKQRFRWAYGAIQILRHHAGRLFGRTPSRLSTGQRYHFIAGWLPWLADAMNLGFTAAAIAWSLLMLVAPIRFDPPLLEISALPLSLFAFKVIKMIFLYRSRVQASTGQTVAAAVAGLALSHTIARAVMTGLATTERPFLRTPKLAHAQPWRQALSDSREEALLAVALWLAAWGVAVQPHVESPDLLGWIVVLLVQSLPYLAAVLLALVSALPGLPAALVRRRGPMQEAARG